MTTLVTGAHGFVGSHIVDQLTRQGQTVIALDQEPLSILVRRFLGARAAQVTWVQADIRRRDELVAVARRYGVTDVVHAAALTPTPHMAEHQRRTIIAVNLKGTVNMLETARAVQARRFLFVSSDAVYGPVSGASPWKEDAPLAGEHLYALCKRAGERLCRRFHDRFGLETIVARLGTVYGPLERATHTRPRPSLPFALVQRALSGQTTAVYGADRRRSYCYVADAAEGMVGLLQVPQLQWKVYNVGSPMAVPLRTLLDVLAQQVAGFTWHEVQRAEAAEVVLTSAQVRAALDVSRLKTTVGFAPLTTLDSGLAATYDWAKTRLN